MAMSAAPRAKIPGRSAATRYSTALALVASAALAMALAFYLGLRPAGSVRLLPAALHAGGGLVTMPHAALLQSLPSLLHVYAFCLLSAAVLGPGFRRVALLAAFWVALETAFELSQHPWLKERVAGYDGIAGALTRRTATFDPADLAAIVAGALAATLTIRYFRGSFDRET